MKTKKAAPRGMTMGDYMGKKMMPKAKSAPASKVAKASAKGGAKKANPFAKAKKAY